MWYQMKEKKQSFPQMYYTCTGLLIIEIRACTCTELKNTSWYKTPRQLPKNTKCMIKGLKHSVAKFQSIQQFLFCQPVKYVIYMYTCIVYTVIGTRPNFTCYGG